jgi:hypothetical protein
MSIYERLDRVHGLTHQNWQVPYRVGYNTSGTFLTAASIENKPVEFRIGGQPIISRGFVADTKTYSCESISKNEALFLVTVLNSPIVDGLIKPMQSRGLWGPRDIHKKVLELPIPNFDAANPTHRRLAEFGKECSAKVEHWLAGGTAGNVKSIGRLRGLVREMLKDELNEIDRLVKEILGG